MKPATYNASTADVCERDQIEYWANAFGSVWGEVDLFKVGRGEFYGAFRSVRVSSLRVNRISFKGLGFRRSTQQAEKLEVPFYSVAFPLSGRSIVSMASESTKLCRNRVFLLDNSLPAELLAPDAYETMNIQIPVNLIRERIGGPYRGPTAQLAVNSPAANVLHHYVRALYGSNPNLDERSARFLERQVCDLVVLCFSDRGALLSHESALLGAQRERVARYIERAYANEQLSPDAIAAACGISPSYLHKIYRASGRTVMEHVRETRLDAADMLLRKKGVRHSTISEIAYAVGFKSLAEFSRAYKRRFGASPLRAQA